MTCVVCIVDIIVCCCILCSREGLGMDKVIRKTRAVHMCRVCRHVIPIGSGCYFMEGRLYFHLRCWNTLLEYVRISDCGKSSSSDVFALQRTIRRLQQEGPDE